MQETTQSIGTEELALGPWKLQIHRENLIVSETEKEVLSDVALRWAKIFPNDPKTLSHEAFSVPSVLIRFDYVVVDGTISIYEVEDRPAFLAIGSLINWQFGEKLADCIDGIRKHLCRPVSILVSPSRLHNSDDLLFCKEVPLPIFDGVASDIAELPADAALIVRSDRHESDYWHLEPRSLSTVSKEGWKGYGVPLGLWEPVSPEGVDYNSAFVVKPEYGCRSSDVLLFHPERNSKGKYGFSTRTAIQNAVDTGRVKYVQPYAEPEHHDFLGQNYFLIRRVYFGFDPASGTYACLGGVYMARTCAKVHGSSDAVTGCVMV